MTQFGVNVGKTQNMNALAEVKTLASLDVIFAQKEYSDGRISRRFLSGYGVYTT